MKNLLLLTYFILVACVTGCATSSSNPWKANGQVKALAPLQPIVVKEVELRVVGIEQFRAAEVEDVAYFESRNLAPEDMAPADGRATRAILLKHLRIQDNPDLICEVARASFADWAANPNQVQLIAYAKGVGAHVVVLAVENLGQREFTVRQPVTTSTFMNMNTSAYSGGQYASGSGYGNATSTTYIPVTKRADAYGKFALFLRRLDPEERALLDTLYKK